MITKSLALAAVVVILLASCEKTPATNYSHQVKSVRIRIDPNNFVDTKSIGPKLTPVDKFATPTKLWIYISKANGELSRIIPVATSELEVNGDQPGLTIDALKTGFEIKNISTESSTIQIIANPKTESIPEATLKSMLSANQVKALSTEIRYESDPQLVTLYAEAPIVKLNSSLYSANMELKPIVSRLQIKLDYDRSTMADVNFKGVFLRNIYKKVNFSGTGSILYSPGSLSAPAGTDSLLFSDSYYSGSFVHNSGGFSSADTTGKVFGFQFFPAAAPLVNPEVVVKYSARAKTAEFRELCFERVISFKNMDGSVFSNWQPGKLYNFKIVVGRGNEDPVADKAALDVSITMASWGEENILSVI